MGICYLEDCIGIIQAYDSLLATRKTLHQQYHYALLVAFMRYFPKTRVPQYRPQYTIILNMGTPKKVPLIFGNSHASVAEVRGSKAMGSWP